MQREDIYVGGDKTQEVFYIKRAAAHKILVEI